MKKSLFLEDFMEKKKNTLDVLFTKKAKGRPKDLRAITFYFYFYKRFSLSIDA